MGTLSHLPTLNIIIETSYHKSILFFHLTKIWMKLNQAALRKDIVLYCIPDCRNSIVMLVKWQSHSTLFIHEPVRFTRNCSSNSKLSSLSLKVKSLKQKKYEQSYRKSVHDMVATVRHLKWSTLSTCDRSINEFFKGKLLQIIYNKLKNLILSGLQFSLFQAVSNKV